MKNPFLCICLTFQLWVASTTSSALPASPQIQPDDCPKISVSCSDVNAGNDTPILFQVHLVRGTRTHDISYHWTVSNGTIKKGQGTAVIEVEAVGRDREGLTGTVDVGGFDPDCAHIASCSTQVEGSTTFTCSQPAGEQTALIGAAEKGGYTTRRVEFIGNNHTPDHVLRRRTNIGLSEGDSFTGRRLLRSLNNVSKLRIIYPVKLKDVVVQLDERDRAVDVHICFKEK